MAHGNGNPDDPRDTTKRFLIRSEGHAPLHAAPVMLAGVRVTIAPLGADAVPTAPTAFGLAAERRNAWSVATTDPADDRRFEGYSDWELAHQLRASLQGDGETLVEPDLRQTPIIKGDRREKDEDLALARGGRTGPWHLEAAFSRLGDARDTVADAKQRDVTIVQLDTGYDPTHELAPAHIRDGADFESGTGGAGTEPMGQPGLRSVGHGTGTAGILAGGSLRTGGSRALPTHTTLGAIPGATVVPVRVANFVAQFWSSSIAAGLWHAIEQRADVVTISLGGLPSQAWADAINACYDNGIVVVAAAGNNFGGFPVRDMVWPARFRRVIGVCGITEDQTPYIDRHGGMEGNFGPNSVMGTAMAAYTPRIPWPLIGTGDGIDQDGAGTSAATPQVAAAAALWIAQHRQALANVTGWKRAELVRAALFGSARAPKPGQELDQYRPYIGRGVLDARAALARSPEALQHGIRREEPDTAAFAIFRALGRLGIDADPAAAMYELEAMHIATRSVALKRILPDTSALAAPGMERRVAETLLDSEAMSPPLRRWLSALIGRRAGGPGGRVSPADEARSSELRRLQQQEQQAQQQQRQQQGPGGDLDTTDDDPFTREVNAVLRPDGTGGGPTTGTASPTLIDTAPADGAFAQAPTKRRISPPAKRRLRIFAGDPSAALSMTSFRVATATVEIPWEPRENDMPLPAGPVGEYVEVVDVDPASNTAYEPLDLNDLNIVSQDGLAPDVDNPKFHQQMVYAVAMLTIDRFERVLGRPMLWQTDRFWKRPRRERPMPGTRAADEEGYVPRLRIYPHGLRASNAFYSPDKVALQFGYFRGMRRLPDDTVVPGDMVFTCLSFDVIAHETTHALLDGVNRRLRDPSNPDVLAFHEAFADILAIFQRFTLMDLLRHEIIRARGRLRASDLGKLAKEFGQATGYTHALRDAINSDPAKDNYLTARDPHGRGSVLVAAVFDAFVNIYDSRVERLLSIAPLPGGRAPLHPTLVELLAAEARKAADHTLAMCIRALDYLPPVDITFSDFLRALITADADIEPEDAHGYRVAFIEAFRRRCIFPENVRAVSVSGLQWNGFADELRDLRPPLAELGLRWDRDADRRDVYVTGRRAGAILNRWLSELPPEKARLLGLSFDPENVVLDLLDSVANSIRRYIEDEAPGWRVDDGAFLAIIEAFAQKAWARGLGARTREKPKVSMARSLGELAILRSMAPEAARNGAGGGLDLQEPITALLSRIGPLFSREIRDQRARRVEVSSVRPVQRVTPSGRVHHDIVIVIQQGRVMAIDPALPFAPWNLFTYRSGSTVIVNADDGIGERFRYVIVKNPQAAASNTAKSRFARNRSFALRGAGHAERTSYFSESSAAEPFAMLHGH